ncbi:MAG: hypothetical protein HY590_01245 [Candidatus Omnitrophica bacterium]|nr:hypothetical protein [Candidatus Omnitrophota bacterium]
MTQKQFNLVTGTIFAVIAVLHLLRLIYHWNALIANRPVPLGVSVVACVVAGYLAWQGFRLRK